MIKMFQRLFGKHKRIQGPQNLGPYTGQGTVLLSYVTKMASLATDKSPEELIRFLKNHLDNQFQIIEEHSGIVVQFVGDSVLAYWTSQQTEDHATLAMSAAQKTLRVVDDSIGIHVIVSSGPMIADYFGFNRFHLQIFGQAMDIANSISKLPIQQYRCLLTTKETLDAAQIQSNSAVSFGQLKNGLQVYSVAAG